MLSKNRILPPHAIIALPMQTAQRDAGRSTERTREVIEAFLKNAKQPMFLVCVTDQVKRLARLRVRNILSQ